MNLTDAGALVGLADKNDPDHPRCVAAARALPKAPLLTTWPCFTEVTHLLHREGGYRAQEELWRLRRNGVVEMAADVARLYKAILPDPSANEFLPMSVLLSILIEKIKSLTLPSI